MPCSARALLLAGVSLAVIGAGGVAWGEEAEAPTEVDGVVITGGHVRTSAVTGLDMSLRETPQSVTIVDQEKIRDFGLTNVNDLLNQVTGVNVEKVETDRT